jgi:type II secretory pathway predicted ATPase ExeA/cell division septation protein DedD
MELLPTAPFTKPTPSVRSPFLTYEPYYGLREKPFSLSADPRFLYKSPAHSATFDDLRFGIRRREGLIVLTGDIGIGKTTICRAVLDQLDRKTFSTFVPDPFVSREDLLKMLLVDFGVMSVDDLKSGRLSGASRPDLSYPLYEFLKSLVPLQAYAVLVIDEAQNLSVSLLEEIRILSDLEDPEKLLQVVLVGQLEFRSKLKLPEMRQLDQRVSVRCSLEPLTREGVDGYIAHRLQVAGGGHDRVVFSADSVAMIYEASHGVPRVINLVCDRALSRGFAQRKSVIDPDTVSQAIAELGIGDLSPHIVSEPQETQKGLVFGHDTPRPRGTGLNSEYLTEDRHVPMAEKTERAARTEKDTPLLEAFSVEAAVPESLLRGSSAARVDVLPTRRVPSRVGRVVAVMGAAVVVLLFLFADWSIPFGDAQLSAPPSSPAPAAPPPAQTAAPVEAAPAPVEKAAAPVPPAATVVPAPAPELPAVAPPQGQPYAIDVALFNSAGRARTLVEQLAGAGFTAYQMEIDLGARGRPYVVLVGSYASPEAAAEDLSRIRQIPGYLDARVIRRPDN